MFPNKLLIKCLFMFFVMLFQIPILKSVHIDSYRNISHNFSIPIIRDYYVFDSNLSSFWHMKDMNMYPVKKQNYSILTLGWDYYF